MTGHQRSRVAIPLLVLGLTAMFIGLAPRTVVTVKEASQDADTAALVVENPSPEQQDPSFRLSRAPLLTLGDRTEDAEFEILNVSDAAVLPSGHLALVLLDFGSIRIFDSTGRFVRAIGRKGRGPAEYEWITQVVAAEADSIYVYDFNRGQLTLVDSLGRVARTIRQRGVRCCFADGSFLLERGYNPLRLLPANRRERFAPLTTFLRVVGPWSKPRTDTVLQIRPSDPPLSAPVVSTSRDGTSRPVRFGYSLPFASRIHIELAPHAIVQGRGDTYSFQIHRPDGTLDRVVRAAVSPRAITRRIREAGREDFLREARVPADRREALSKLYDRYAHRSYLPAYSDLLVEEDARIWIKSYTLPADSRQLWAAFSFEGRSLGTLHLPSDVRVMRFSRGRVVLYHSSLETETISVYRIHDTRSTAHDSY